MKLIEQLVEYLRSRGSLTPQQIKRLESKGFIPATEEEPEVTSPPALDVAEEPDWEDLYAEPEPPRPSRKSRRRARAPERELTPEELCARLAERFSRWEPDLQGLVAVESHFGPCSGWREAVDGIGKRSVEELAQALTTILREASRFAGTFWTTLSFDVQRDQLGGLSSETGSAYRALLRGGPVSEFSKHVWLLKYDEAAQVYRLVRAQKTLLQALRLVYRTTPQAVRRSLRGAGRFHLLALLEAAHWLNAVTQRLTARAARFYLLPPGEEEWWPAWSMALPIDPARAAALLQHCKSDPFVPVPLSQVPGELWRFTVGEEEWRGRAADERLLAAIRQVIDPAQDGALPALLAGLRHPYPLVRWHALEQLERSIPASVVSALDDPEWEIGLRAARCLHATGEDTLLGAVAAALPGILTAVGEDGAARAQALTLLESLGARASAAVPLLASWTRDPSQDIRLQLARTLGRLPAAAAAAVPLLLELLRDPIGTVSVHALLALGELGAAAAPAVPALLEILAGPDALKRSHAARSLGAVRAHAAEVIPALMAALDDPETGVRAAALAALASFGPQAAPPDAVLVRFLEEADLVTRRTAIASLTRFERIEAVAAPLIRILGHDPSGLARGDASMALGQVAPLILLPHLPELIAAWARLGGSNNEAAALLAPFNDRTRDAVRQALAPLWLNQKGPEGQPVQPRQRHHAAAQVRAVSAVVARVLPRLVDVILADPESTAGQKALGIVASADGLAVEVVAVLTQALESPDAEIRAQTAAALKTLADCARELVPVVLRPLRVGKSARHFVARSLLEWLAPLAVAGMVPGDAAKGNVKDANEGCHE